MPKTYYNFGFVNTSNNTFYDMTQYESFSATIHYEIQTSLGNCGDDEYINDDAKLTSDSKFYASIGASYMPLWP
jgi:hypothetical protein